MISQSQERQQKQDNFLVFITAYILDAASPSLYFSGAYLRRRFKPQFSAS